MKLLKILQKEWFLVGMVVAIGLAVLFPKVGASKGPIHLGQLTQYGIALIFFLYGVGLSPQMIRKGLGNWQLHIFTQAATFILYPIIWLILGHWFKGIMPHALAFGFCYLLVLPSTISSSVAMTAIAKGNIPGAIFNASLSSILGIFLTPFYVQLFIGFSGGAMDITATILHIMQMLLLPMVIGQLVRPLLHTWISNHKKITGKVDKVVILMIVFNAFCNSVIQGIWHDFDLSTLIIAVLLCAAILTFVLVVLLTLARVFGFNKEDEIAGLFCGTKKTLAAGVPMAKVIFGSNPMLGMLLLPIMLYHPLQIFICAILANRYAARSPQHEPHTKVN
ncbi:MAG: hypothetical protein CENE_03730 [Candidatus Celerinatantimonas neptuna]|nr:MAG: hypothetical protein CENE_03730 [Candidatus Celerinatantimonas neptuna]